MMVLIIAPAPFEDLETWQAFLSELETLAKENPDDSNVKEAIANAKAEIDGRGN